MHFPYAVTVHDFCAADNFCTRHILHVVRVALLT